MLESGFDVIHQAFPILDAYIYLIPAEIIENASIIFSRFVGFLDPRLRETIGLITHSLDLLFCSAAKLAGVKAAEQIVSSLLSTGLLKSVLDLLHDSYDAQKSSGPNKRHSLVDDVVETGEHLSTPS